MINVGGQLIQVRSRSGQTLWAQFGVSSQQRTPQVILTFRRADNGATVQWTGFLTTDKIGKDGLNSYERALDSMHTVGFSGDDLDSFNDQAPHGKVSLAIEAEEYNGTVRDKVKFVNSEAYTIGDDDRLAGKGLKDLSAKLKAAKKSAGSGWNANGPGREPGDDGPGDDGPGDGLPNWK